MSLREKMEKNQPAVIGGSIAVIVLAFGWVIWSIMGSSRTITAATPKAYYTVDNGKSWFPDDDVPAKIPPFDHEGKKAYKVLLWTCDGGKTTFVSGLVRYSDQARNRLTQAVASNTLDDDPVAQQVLTTNLGVEVKQPGTPDEPASWFKSSDRKGVYLLFPPCPNGGNLTQLTPGVELDK